MSNTYMVGFCTVPNAEEGAKIASALVEEKLAACVNVIDGLRSFYYWDGKVCDDPEALLMIKSRHDRFDALKERIVELHPYDVAEVIAFDIASGHTPYLNWIDESLDR